MAEEGTNSARSHRQKGEQPRFSVMQTARFSPVVAAAGRPESHLVFADPERDRTLQAAVKAERVMTIFQNTAGNKADHGEVGFDPGSGRQFLIFPKSLRKFKGRSVVGIKYDLIRSPDISKAQLAPPPKKPPPKKREVPHQEPETPSLSKSLKNRRVAGTKPPIPEEPEMPPDEAGEEPKHITALKNQVRRAMKHLEQGKQVAAFNMLKRIVEH